MLEGFTSGNKNVSWLDNIIENLKNLENIERKARLGFENTEELTNLPYNQWRFILPEVQYENLKLMATELYLVLNDVIPIIQEVQFKEFVIEIDTISEQLKNRSSFITESFSLVKNKVISVQLTNFFYETLKYLISIKRKLIKELSPILYVKSPENPI